MRSRVGSCRAHLSKNRALRSPLFSKLFRYRTPHRSESVLTDRATTLITPLGYPAAAIRKFLVLHV
ncbi:hypothetical protein IG631_21016 [Alternaria alternata]|nr:hypothetical protein IG631_21016 [Alternaria alternata]